MEGFGPSSTLTGRLPYNLRGSARQTVSLGHQVVPIGTLAARISEKIGLDFLLYAKYLAMVGARGFEPPTP